MGDLPSYLEKVWKAKHFDDAEKAFADKASGKKMSSGPSFFQNAKVEEEEAAVNEQEETVLTE